MRPFGPVARALPLVGAVLLFATCEPLTAPGPAGTVALAVGADSVLVVGSTTAPAVVVTVGGTPLERPDVRFESADTNIVAVANGGTRLVARRRGSAVVTVRLVSAVAQQPAPSLEQMVYVVARKIRLSAAAATLTALGDTLRLKGTSLDAADKEVTDDAPFAWTSSDTLVAKVSTDGLVIARKGGRAVIRVTTALEKEADSTVVQVQQQRVRFALTPTVLTLDAVGAQQRLAAIGRDRADSTIPGDTIPTWTSDNPAVVTVAADGRVTAQADGAARVIASSGAVRDTVTVTVKQRASEVSLFAPGGEGSPATGFRIRTLKGALQFSASGRDLRGNTVARAVPVFTSTAPRVARIDTLGLLTALDTGTTQVIARIDAAADTVQVRVSNDPAAVMVLLADTSRLGSVSETMRLRARVLNAVGDSIAGIPVTWRSLDPGVAAVAGDSATALGVGTARVVASASSGAVADTAYVVVSNFAGSVAMARRDTTLASVGDAFAPAITVANAKGLPVGRDALAWSSSDTLVAAVSFTGTVTARGRGRALVRAVSPTNSAIRDSINVEVTNAPASLSLNAEVDELTAVGAQRAYRATVRNARGTLLVGDRVTWRTEPIAVATVNDTGLVTTVGTGAVRVIAEAGSAATGVVADTVRLLARSIARSLLVTRPAADDSVITARGSGVAMLVQARDSLGNVAAVSGLRWRSGNDAVAKVDSLTGALVATGVGSTTIVASADGGATATRRVVVQDLPAKVDLVDLSKTLSRLNETYTPDVRIRNVNDSLIADRSAVQWTSKDPSVVSVTAAGVVTAVHDGGPTYVVAAIPGVARDSVMVTVTNKPASVDILVGTLSTPTLSLEAIGASGALGFVLYNSSGIALDPALSGGVDWALLHTRLDNAIAVTAAGVVTAVRVGRDTVVATPKDGTGVDSLFVTVTQRPKTASLLPLDTTTVSLGDTFSMRPTVFDSLNTPIPGVLPTYSSSNPTVASVDAATGLVTAQGVGTATITAVVAGTPGAVATVRVENRPDAVDVVPVLTTLNSIGDTFTPALVVKNKAGAAIAGPATLVVWSSTDAALVSVSAAGLVTALAPTGATPVYVRAVNPLDASKRDSVQVVVTNAIASLTVLDSLQRTIPGDSVHFGSSGSAARFTAVARNASNAVVAVTPLWSTSDPSVATVTTEGVVTAVGNGRAEITATAGGRSDVTVIGVRRAVRTLVPSAASVALGAVDATQALSVTALDSAGLALTPASVAWTSANTAIATVNGTTGLVTAKAVGSTTITVKAPLVPGSSTLITATVPVTVTNAPTTIQFAVARDSLRSLGDKLSPTVTITNSAGTTLLRSGAVWSTDDGTIASVSTLGEITAVAEGTTKVRATSGVDPTVTDSITIVVVNKPTSVVISPSAPTLRALDRTVTLTATARNARPATVPDAVFSWSSSNTAVATVTSAGEVRAVGVGTAVITAATTDRVSAADSARGTTTVTVRNAPATIDVQVDSTSIPAPGETYTPGLLLRNLDNATIAGGTAAWASKNTGVATVNASTGEITGVAVGTTFIVASTLNDAGATIKDSVKIVVQNLAATVQLAPDDSVTLTSLDETYSVVADIRNRRNVTIADQTSVTWTSDDATVASVSPSGVITAKALGGTWIRAFAPTDPTARDSVRVRVRNDVTSVIVTAPTMSDTLIAAGQFVTYSAVAKNAKGGVVPGTVITWTSSDPTVVSVGAPGASTNAQMVAPGTVTVTASADGATATVTSTPITLVAINPTIVYVSDSTVTGTRYGTRRRPLATIAAGIALAGSADTVLVRRSATTGYNEALTIAKDLTLLGDTAAFTAGSASTPSLLPVLRHTTGAAAITTSGAVTVGIKGLAVKQETAGPAMSASGATLTLDWVYVNPLGATPATATGAGFLLTSGTAVVRNSGARLTSGYGLRGVTMTSLTVTGFTADSVAGDGLEVDGGTLVSVTGSRFSNNGKGATFNGTVAALTFDHNDLYGNTQLGAENLPILPAYLVNWWGDSAGPRRTAAPKSVGDSVTFDGVAPAIAGYLTAPVVSTGTVESGLVVVGGTAQSTAKNTDFDLPVAVRVVDARGRAVVGVSVNFTSVGTADVKFGDLETGPVNSNSKSASTDASGIARVRVKATGDVGSVTVRATAAGIGFVEILLTTTN